MKVVYEQHLNELKNHYYEFGQWEAFNKVLNYLNTIDTNTIDKKEFYKTIMDFRPASIEVKI